MVNGRLRFVTTRQATDFRQAQMIAWAWCRHPAGAALTIYLPLIGKLKHASGNERGMNSIEIAILTKLNELADRYGVKPYEFVAYVRSSYEHEMTLTVENPFPLCLDQADRFMTMLEGIGVEINETEKIGLLKGSAEKICTALDHALHLAPKSRRHR